MRGRLLRLRRRRRTSYQERGFSITELTTKSGQEWERNYHEITLNELEFIRKSLFLSVDSCTLDLIFVEIQTGDMSPCELDNLPSRSTNTASNIQDLHTRFDTDVVSKVVFMASDSTIEGLAVSKAAEVKRLRPPVLVEICSEVIVSRMLISTQSKSPRQTHCRVKLA